MGVISSRAKSVLIIEDNVSHAELLTEIFDRNFSPIIIHTVDSFDKAVNLLEDYIYDLIISDCLIEDLCLKDRFDELKFVGKDTPIIVISGIDDSHMAAKLIKIGASEYISKTTESLEKLPSIIARYFSTEDKHPKPKKNETMLKDPGCKNVKENLKKLLDDLKSIKKNHQIKNDLLKSIEEIEGKISQLKSNLS